jgi:hypothetical protein
LALTDEESYNETKEEFLSSNEFASLDKDTTNTFQNNKKVFELQQRPYPQQINMAIHYLKSNSHFSYHISIHNSLSVIRRMLLHSRLFTIFAGLLRPEVLDSSASSLVSLPFAT